MPDSTRGEKPQTVLFEDGHFDGVLLAAGPVRIEGRLNGPVIGTSLVEIGPQGSVDGPIEAPEIQIEGRVTGDLEASGRVTLSATARVAGRIAAPRLVAEDGSRVDGSARVGELPGAAREPAKP